MTTRGCAFSFFLSRWQKHFKILWVPTVTPKYTCSIGFRHEHLSTMINKILQKLWNEIVFHNCINVDSGWYICFCHISAYHFNIHFICDTGWIDKMLRKNATTRHITWNCGISEQNDVSSPNVVESHQGPFSSKLRLCLANHRPGYWSNLPCDWPSTAWAYSEQQTENRPSCKPASFWRHVSVMASRVSGISTVRSTAVKCNNEENIQAPQYWFFVSCEGNPSWSMSSPNKGPLMRKALS